MDAVNNNGFEPFALSVIHGIVLTLILVGLVRLRSWLIFANILIGLVCTFMLFLLVDGIVSGPLSVDTGLLCGAALVIISPRTNQKRRQSKSERRSRG